MILTILAPFAVVAEPLYNLGQFLLGLSTPSTRPAAATERVPNCCLRAAL
jgi:hypothetical protein